jgi:predicted amidohydrolase
MKIKVGVAQYDVPESVEDSVSKLDEVVKKASANSVKLLVAPETAIGMLGDVKTAGTDYLPQLKDICKRNSVTLATSFYHKEDGKFYNQGYIVSDNGDVFHSYRKIYLAPPEKEQDGISSGKKFIVSRTSLGKLGMMICKDGFNKYSHYLYQQLFDQEADITCIPTWSLGWKEMDIQEYIRSIYVYGAFISRSFFLVAGNLNKSTSSFGKSLIISPVRGILKEGSSDREEILIEEIDTNDVKRAREFDSWWQPKKQCFFSTNHQ